MEECKDNLEDSAPVVDQHDSVNESSNSLIDEQNDIEFRNDEPNEKEYSEQIIMEDCKDNLEDSAPIVDQHDSVNESSNSLIDEQNDIEFKNDEPNEKEYSEQIIMEDCKDNLEDSAPVVDQHDSVNESSNSLIDEQNDIEFKNDEPNEKEYSEQIVMEDCKDNLEDSAPVVDQHDSVNESSNSLIDKQNDIEVRNDEPNEKDATECESEVKNVCNDPVKEEFKDNKIESELIENDRSWKNHNLRTIKKKNITYKDIEEPIEEDKDNLIIVNNKRKKINDGRFHCDFCSQAFLTKRGLVLHKKFHKKADKFTCSYCQQVFESNDDLKSHKEIHVAEKVIYTCVKCELAFSDQYQWLKHNVNHTRKNQYFCCVECGIFLKTKTGCYLHMETHFNRVYPCTKCDKVFSSELKQKIHVRSHDENVSKCIECGECGKLLSDERALRRHLNVHAGIFTCQCLYCGKGFITEAARKVHTRVHTGERPYSCKICGDKFKQFTDHKKHMTTHDVEKKYQCDICRKKFYHKESMTSHIRSHIGLNKYKCKVCPKKFPYFANLRIHTLYCHVDEKTYKCQICNMNFKTTNCVRKHKLTIKHKNKEYEILRTRNRRKI